MSYANHTFTNVVNDLLIYFLKYKNDEFIK